MRFKSLQAMLIWAVALLIVVPFALNSWIAIGQVNQISSVLYQGRMDATAETAREIYGGLANEALAFASLIAKRQDVAEALNAGDRKKLESLMTAEYEDLKKQYPLLRTLELTDAEGTVIMRGHNPTKFGDNKKTHPMVQKALTGQPNSGITVSPTTGQTAMDGIFPIQLGGRVVGTIKLGFYTNDDVAKHLKQTAHVEVLMFSARENAKTKSTDLLLVGSTFDKVDGAEFRSETGTEKDSLTHQEKSVTQVFLEDKTILTEVVTGKAELVREVTVNGTTYLAKFTPIVDIGGQANGVLTLLLDETDLQAGRSRSMLIFLGVGAAGLLAGLLFGVTISRNISRPLNQLTGSFERMAQGDLSVQMVSITSEHEVGRLGKAFNLMVSNLRPLIEGLSASAATLLKASEELTAASSRSASGSREVAETVEQVATGAGEQAHASAEVRATMEELRATIQQMAGGADQTAHEVQSASRLLGDMTSAIDGVTANARGVAEETSLAAETVRSGARVVEETIEGMQRIRQVVGESAERIRHLEQLTDQIGQISQVITGISAQTNLLALNAAIEAARAGENGRGFAVVADEVRKLAERSAVSAKEITTLILNIQSSTEQVVKAMDTGTAEVERGSSLAAETGVAFKQILPVMEHAEQAVQSISVASDEIRANAGRVMQAFRSVSSVSEQTAAASVQMSEATSQVTVTTGRMAAVSEENAAAAEEVAAAVEDLRSSATDVASAASKLGTVARELAAQVDRFKL